MLHRRMIAFRSWSGAQARALVVVAAVAHGPTVGRRARGAVAGRVVEEQPGGVAASVYGSGRGRRRPALVFFNGVTARGRHHPDVRRLARALSQVGFLVVVPDLPGLSSGRIDAETVASAVAVVAAVADRPDVKGGRVGLVGVSIGATLALVAAEEMDLAARVTVVAAIAPFADFVNAVRLATTAHARVAGRLVPFEPAAFLGLVVARSLVAAMPSGPLRDGLLAELELVPDNAPDPLGRFRSGAGEAEDAHALVALLGNRDPERFDDLYEALPVDLRGRLARLSPLTRAAALRAPVEIALGPSDTYLPLAEAHSLIPAATGTRVRVTVTSALRHADTRPGRGDPVGLLRFEGWVARTINAARRV